MSYMSNTLPQLMENFFIKKVEQLFVKSSRSKENFLLHSPFPKFLQLSLERSP